MTQLKIPEERFWKMTLRKFEALWDEHVAFNNEGQENPSKPKSALDDDEEITLDQIKGL